MLPPSPSGRVGWVQRKPDARSTCAYNTYVACLLLAGDLVGGRLGRALRRLVVIECSGDDAGGLELEPLYDAAEVAPDRPEEVEEQYGHGQRQLPLELRPRAEQVRIRVGVRAAVLGAGVGVSTCIHA